jgi:glutamine amidotransferase
MDGKTTAIVDFGAGNLTSVACALRHLGREPLITRKPEDLLRADRVIFPGVGAAGASMETLARLELDGALREFHRSGRPLLGICIGCQVVFERSDEDGGTPCLGLLRGSVRGFSFPPGSAWKVPHMGWNEVAFLREHPVFAGLPPRSQFYFVHGYYPVPEDEDVIAGTTEHGGVRFASAVARGNLAAVQFHAEKSGPAGLRILRNFLEWEPGGI